MFYNEICEETKVLRLPDETSQDREWRALCQLTQWYNKHLQYEKQIILLSENRTAEDSEVVVMTMKQYLDAYWKDNALLQNLVQVLADVVLEDNLEDGKIKISSKLNASSNSTTGYTEVILYAEVLVWSSLLGVSLLV
jgi:DIS3-like exonuclease 1